MLSCAENKTFAKKQVEQTKHLQDLLKEHDNVDHDVIKEGLELKELETKVEKVTREVMDIKNKHHIQDSNLEEISRQSRIDENLETRLNVVSKWCVCTVLMTECPKCLNKQIILIMCMFKSPRKISGIIRKC